MPIRPEDVPSDPARLVAMVLALDTENERLRAIVRTLKDLLFGARSERAAVIDIAQLPLDLDDLAVGPTPPPPPANDEGVAERKLKRPRSWLSSAPYTYFCAWDAMISFTVRASMSSGNLVILGLTVTH